MGLSVRTSLALLLDVDYASEGSTLTRYQIMQQAGVSALGQARAIPWLVNSLLS